MKLFLRRRSCEAAVSHYVCPLKQRTLYQKIKKIVWSKLKAFADDKLNVNQLAQFVRDTIKNNVGKGENAGCQHFLLFSHCF